MSGSVDIFGKAAAEALGDGHISIAFQYPALLPWLSCRDNAGWLMQMRSGKRPDHNEITKLAALVELEDRVLSQQPGGVSGGECQRVALMRALFVDAQLLIMDEPLSAVDFKVRKRIIARLRERLKRKEQTSLLVTHDLSDAVHFADEIFVISPDGKGFRPVQVTLGDPRNPDIREKQDFKNLVAEVATRWG